MSRSRSWFITAEAALEDDFVARVNAANPRFFMFGHEIGPLRGYQHLQGMIEWRDAKTFTATKAIVGDRVHIEQRKGSFEQCHAYCSKDRQVVEFGERLEPGKRTDLETIKDRLEEGVSLKEIVHEFPSQVMRYGRGIREVQALLAEPRTWKTHVTVIWGPTNTGKSWRCAELGPPGKAHWQPSTSKWWNGYEDQETVVIDEFDPSTTPFSRAEMLQLMDRYPFKVEGKNTVLEFRARRLIIASNFDPRLWWPVLPECLMRRIDTEVSTQR